MEQLGSKGRWQQGILVLAVWLLLQGAKAAEGIRFVIDKKECWQHEVPYDGDQVRVSYVVIKSESSWSFDHTAIGLDLIVRLKTLFMLNVHVYGFPVFPGNASLFEMLWSVCFLGS